MQSVELEHEGLEIKFHEATIEQAQAEGFKSVKPISLNYLSVHRKKRNRGNGKALLNMVQEYAEKNNFDLIFGTIPNYAEFSRDERTCFFSDVDMIKDWLFRNGYSINADNNVFHKPIEIKKSCKYYGGIGFSNCNEHWEYEVITEHEKKVFLNLSEAKLFYNNVKGEKSIYDSITNELIDAWYRIPSV